MPATRRPKRRKADAKLESYRKDASKELDKAASKTEATLNNAVDKFDKSVSEVSDFVWESDDLNGRTRMAGDCHANNSICRAQTRRRADFPDGSAAVARRSKPVLPRNAVASSDLSFEPV